MADLIPSSMGQAMAQAGTENQGSPPSASATNPIQTIQQKEDDTVAQSDTGEQRPKGTLEDQRKAILAKNPNAKLPATPTMQAEYVQIVTRFMLMIHDVRQPNPKIKSPCEAAMRQMNNPKLSVAQAVGQTTAQLIFILHNSAKMQKVSYNPNVLFRAADECCAVAYLLGVARGIFNGVPKFKGKKAGVPYKFEPAEMKILYQAKVYAVQWFGKLMTRTGQISPQDAQKAQQHWDDEIKKEIASGKVTDAQVRAAMMHPANRPAVQAVAPRNVPGDNAAIDSNAGQAAQPGAPSQPGQQPPAQGQGVAPAQPPAGNDDQEQQ